MDTANGFWLDLWARRAPVRFHAQTAEPLLVNNIGRMNLPPGARFFVPLCGMTVDIGWLRAHGYRVAGAELSPVAVENLFDTLGERPEIDRDGPLERWRARDVEVFVGDIFDLTPERLGPVDAVWDRAALVALPEDTRRRYAAHLVALTAGAPQLVSSFSTAEGAAAGGPPFAVGPAEIGRLYGASMAPRLLWEMLDEPSGETDQLWLIDRAA